MSPPLFPCGKLISEYCRILNNPLIRMYFLRKSGRADITIRRHRQIWLMRGVEPPMTAQPLASRPSSDRCESDRLAGYGKSEKGRFCAAFRRNTRADDPMGHNLRCTDSLLAMRQANDIARRIKRGVGRIGERDQGHVGSMGGNGKARQARKLRTVKKFHFR